MGGGRQTNIPDFASRQSSRATSAIRQAAVCETAAGCVVAKAGSAAIATTSSGVSWAHGVPDGECLSQDEAIAALARIVHAAHVPVSADLEGGYGPTASAVVATIEAAMEAGAVGAACELRLEVELDGDVEDDGRELLGHPRVLGVRREVLLALGAGDLVDAGEHAFEVTDARPHVHVPLLLSPYSYTTYRGS